MSFQRDAKKAFLELQQGLVEIEDRYELESVVNADAMVQAKFAYSVMNCRSTLIFTYYDGSIVDTDSPVSIVRYVATKGTAGLGQITMSAGHRRVVDALQNIAMSHRNS